jgi:hypothetical protein
MIAASKVSNNQCILLLGAMQGGEGSVSNTGANTSLQQQQQQGRAPQQQQQHDGAHRFDLNDFPALSAGMFIANGLVYDVIL